MPLGSVTADHEIVSGDCKFVPDAGDRGLGTATAANAEQDAPRTRMIASIRLTARVFIFVSPVDLKGTDDHLARME
jgi:hypothetical protein